MSAGEKAAVRAGELDFDDAITDQQIREYACGIVSRWLTERIKMRESLAAMLNTDKHTRVAAVLREVLVDVEEISRATPPAPPTPGGKP